MERGIQKLHIRNIFRIFIPVADINGLEAHPRSEGNNFGFSLLNNSTNVLQYHIQLYCRQSRVLREYEQQDCFSWAKRNPIIYQNEQGESISGGIILRLNIKQRIFDFRKKNKQLARIQVTCCAEGVVVQQASSEIIQILPKKRKSDIRGAVDDEVTVPVFWQTINNNSNDTVHKYIFNINNVNNNNAVNEITDLNFNSYDSFPPSIDSNNNNNTDNNDTPSNHIIDINEDMETNAIQVYESESSPSDHDIIPYDNHGNENYMVLYNGNAEVVGNFRALNFYKASDINIKEDIRLLVEDRDPRATLLKIDGVDYKFKKGINMDTNRRFVGYIAQQVENVVPEAVQLIDGILHVDYESLIPFLSESIRANYNDIQEIKSHAREFNSHEGLIHGAVDHIYEQFIQRKITEELNSQTAKRTPRLAAFLMPIILILLIVGGGTIGVLYYNRGGHPPTVQKSIEQLALEDFFMATNGHNWKLNFGWMNNISICQWQGITCNDNWHVIVIDLQNNNINGTVPASFGNLKHLTRINMNRNAITGQLPKELFGIETLESISFQSNKFHGTIPEEILTAKSLKTIDFTFNNIGGTVPKVTNMPKLVNFLFGYNNLHGQLPEFMNSSSILGFFDVRWNNISGTLPKMSSISFEVALEHNQISGPVKEALADLTTVQFFRLNSNKLTGEFTLNPIEYTNMMYLNISDNQFTKLSVSIPFGQNCFCQAFKNVFECPYSPGDAMCQRDPCINTTTPIGSR